MPRFGMCRNTYMLSASIKHESFQCSAYFNNRGKKNAVKLYRTARMAGTTTQPPNPTDRPPDHPTVAPAALRYDTRSFRFVHIPTPRRSPSDPRPHTVAGVYHRRGPPGTNRAGAPSHLTRHTLRLCTLTPTLSTHATRVDSSRRLFGKSNAY